MKKYVSIVMIAVVWSVTSGCTTGDDPKDTAYNDADTDTDTDTDTDSDTNADSDTESTGGTDTDCANTECDEPSVVFVAWDVETSGDGTTWDAAFKTVKEGIDAAVALTSACCSTQVWVKAGNYYAYLESQSDSFELAPFVEVYGGFSGTESKIDERDFWANRTVLSSHEFDNSPTRVDSTVIGVDASRIDGFEIVEGNHQAIYNNSASPIIADCFFIGGTAEAVSNRKGSSPTILGSVFMNNAICVSSSGGGTTTIENSVFVHNGGSTDVLVEGADQFIIKNSIFGNHFCSGSCKAAYSSIYSWGNLSIEDSIFVGNEGFGGQSVGTLYLQGTSTILSSVFIGNEFTKDGSSGQNSGDMSMANSTMAENSADQGGAIYVTGDGTMNLYNSILWNNTPDQIYGPNADLVVRYSDVEGWDGGEGNIAPSADPGFVGQVSESVVGEATYDEAHFQSVVPAEEGVGWKPEAFKGLFLKTVTTVILAYDEEGNPEDISEVTDWFYIVDNTENSLFLWGDMREDILEGAQMFVFDFHLSSNSPCIDAGDGDKAPEQDRDGNLRVDTSETLNTGIGSSEYTDMGAYEYQPK
jgi:hypothetical protein